MTKLELIVSSYISRYHDQSSGRPLERSSEWQRAQQKAANSLITGQAFAEAGRDASLFVPGMDENMRAMPNYLIRSWLFAPIAWEKRQFLDGAILYNKGRATLKGWGRQLTEDVADIWLHALYLCSKVPFGQSFNISRSNFLKELGRHNGGHAYDWLHRGMTDLSRFTISIEVKMANGNDKYSIGSHPSSSPIPMLGWFDYCATTREYHLSLDPRWQIVFGNREYGLIDWNKRLQFGPHQYQAKSLQRLISVSSDRVQRYHLEVLKERAQYGSPMHKFRRDALEPAMRELERLEVIAEGRIETSRKGDEQAVWVKL